MKKTLRLLTLLTLVLAGSCARTNEPTNQLTTGPQFGGRLVIAQLNGPRTFNPLFTDDNESLTVLSLLQATLIRINRQTQQTELDLAASADFSPDGRVLTMRLRPDLKFSDGHPLTAEDVVFTFQVIYDPTIPSSVADILKIGGRPIQVEAINDRTIRFTFPEVVAAAERLFDVVNVLPKHILEAAYRAGKLKEAWNVSTPPDQIVGTGPFRVQAYEPGQRLTLIRNPYYWRRDEQGRALPYLDGIDLLIVPDKNTQLLKFQQGQLDMFYPVQAEQVATLQPLVQQGDVALHDLGSSLIAELLWFNLNPGHTQQGKPLVDPVKARWFHRVEFRRAVAMAIDRQAIVDTVFSGRATALSSFVSPGETQWYDAQLAPLRYAADQAAKLLEQIGLVDRDGDGVREDAEGHPVRFTLITNTNPLRQKIGLLIQQDLKKVGLEVVFVPIESSALQDKIYNKRDYEACLFSLQSGDTDPNSKQNFLLSSGSLHYWHPRQKKPATPWEAEIDQLMAEQARTIDPVARKALFNRVQRLMAEQMPVIPLVARNMVTAARQRVGHLKPGILWDHLLWNAEELYIR
ncbi:MAG: ABC transporter substrate-binding protein [Acidobacteriota bacterium]|nr:ABC transporter substrate-binding protein [Blastocatellia bacterium]MDW8240696.1 ABC transporter substrate-binding protein [Acidobacteriota bacterium]